MVVSFRGVGRYAISLLRAPDAAQRAVLHGVVRCRAGAVANSGVWYGPGPAQRHEECRSASGTQMFDYCAALLTIGAPSASTFAMSSRLPVTALVTVSLKALCTAGHCGK